MQLIFTCPVILSLSKQFFIFLSITKQFSVFLMNSILTSDQMLPQGMGEWLLDDDHKFASAIHSSTYKGIIKLIDEMKHHHDPYYWQKFCAA